MSFIVSKRLKLYNIVAAKEPREAGLVRLINNIMQTVSFQLACVIDTGMATGMFEKEVA